MSVVDMRAIDEQGIAKPLAAFIAKVAAAGGMLHVSLDVDFLDPAIAPAVGTTVPGGATFREAHLVMEMLCDSGLVTSLDLVELNPFLDERGRTASLMVDLTASLLGRRVFDRPTHSLLRWHHAPAPQRRAGGAIMHAPKASELAYVPFVSVEHMMQLVHSIGIEPMLLRPGSLHRGRFPPLGALRQDPARGVALP